MHGFLVKYLSERSSDSNERIKFLRFSKNRVVKERANRERRIKCLGSCSKDYLEMKAGNCTIILKM